MPAGEPRIELRALEAWATYDGAAEQWMLPGVAVMAYAMCAQIESRDVAELLKRRGWQMSPYIDAYIRDRGF